VCSDTCIVEAGKLGEMNKRALKIYGIGEKPRVLSQWLISYGLIGVVVSAFGLGSSIRAGSVDTGDAFAILLGFAMLSVGIWGHMRQRKNGLNC
jgi:hypothetical protein